MSETARKFHNQYGHPVTKSTLTLGEVDAFLESLTHVTKEDEQQKILRSFMKRATQCMSWLFVFWETIDDLKWAVRLIDHDLKVNIGAKFVLNALHPDGYDGMYK